MSFKLGYMWCVLISWAILCEANSNNDDDEQQRIKRRQALLESKPWAMRDIQLFGTTLPISPVTVFIVTLSLYNLVRGLTKRSSAVASHILLDSHDDATKQKLVDYKQQINNDASKFATFAKKYSACPSKQQGGNLGKFTRGTMAPRFDAQVFDATAPLNTTLGPIETSFGWHLIYIHERNIVE